MFCPFKSEASNLIIWQNRNQRRLLAFNLFSLRPPTIQTVIDISRGRKTRVFSNYNSSKLWNILKSISALKFRFLARMFVPHKSSEPYKISPSRLVCWYFILRSTLIILNAFNRILFQSFVFNFVGRKGPQSNLRLTIAVSREVSFSLETKNSLRFSQFSRKITVCPFAALCQKQVRRTFTQCFVVSRQKAITF